MLQGRRKDRASTQQLSFTVRRQPLFRLLFVCANHSTAISGVNIVTDLWIIALPIKTLRGINRPLKEKMALILVFGAGLFATTMSAVRLRSIYTYTLATDPFRDAIPVCLHNPVQTRQTRGSRDTDKAHPPTGKHLERHRGQRRDTLRVCPSPQTHIHAPLHTGPQA